MITCDVRSVIHELPSERSKMQQLQEDESLLQGL